MRIEEFLHGFGIALRYPMTDLPAQCEAVGENTALHLLDFLDEKISSFLLIRNELEELKVDAQELQRFWFGWALDETLVEMDVLIEPLQDVRQVLNSLYGPERVTIDSLNHKIRDSLSV
jgi:hypothetical protein